MSLYLSRVPRIWRAAICLIAILNAGCASAATGAGQAGPPPPGTPAAALHQLMTGSAQFTISVEQVPAQGHVASGTGTLSPAASSSTALINVAGGGTTELRETNGTLRLRSYNTPAQRQSAQWVTLDKQIAANVLAWPPTAMDDPTFAFVSADWPSVLAANLVRSRPLGHRTINGVAVRGYQLYLRLFRAAGSEPGPELDGWIDGSGRLRIVTLHWPATENTAGNGPAPSSSAQDWINVTLDLYGFR